MPKAKAANETISLKAWHDRIHTQGDLNWESPGNTGPRRSTEVKPSKAWSLL